MGSGGWGGGCLPLFLMCWQNKFIGQHHTECVRLHNCPLSPLIPSFQLCERKKMVGFTALCSNICSVIPVNFDALGGKSDSQQPVSFLSFLWIMKGCKCTEQHNVMHLIWQAIDTVSAGARRFVFRFCPPRSSFLWCIFMFGSFRSALPNYKPTGACKQKSHKLQCLLIGQSFGICHPARLETLLGGWSGKITSCGVPVLSNY